MRRKAFLVLSVFDFAWYLAMKSIWSGIRGMLGVPWLALVFFLLLTGIAVAQLVLFLLKTKPLSADILGGCSAAFTLVLGYMFLLGIGDFKFIARAFGDILAVLVVLAFAALFVYRYPTSSCARKRWYKGSLFGFFALVVAILSFNLAIPFLTVQPTVYAVEDEYQIVWSTSAPATGTVDVGGVTYRDEYAGSLYSGATVHKVSVPMTALDAAGSYRIASIHYLYRGPYEGIAFGRVAKTYAFTPVDETDGLQYYTLSDVHEYRRAAVKAALTDWNFDFLILAGDISSTYEAKADLEFIGKLAFDIAKGAKPVVFARGNHDVKGEYADELERYVGSVAGDFFYKFRFGAAAGIVLDLGEDHDDSWWEYFGTADYDAYRDRQTAWLETLVADDALSDAGIRYRIAVSHMPIAYVEETGFLSEVKAVWTELLDDLNVDAVLSGHLHEPMVLSPDLSVAPFQSLFFDPDYRSRIAPAGYRTDASFTNFVVSRRSLVQDYGVPESNFGGAFTGLRASVDFDSMLASYAFTNSEGDFVTVMNPFTGETLVGIPVYCLPLA